MKSAAVWRKPNHLPPRMCAKGFAYFGSLWSAERFWENCRIAQQAVKLQQNELGDGDIVPVLQGAKKRGRGFMVGVFHLHGRKEDVRINRKHQDRTPRASSS